MASNRNLIYFLKNIRQKHRLSLRAEHDEGEVWYMYLSPLEAVGGVVALLLVLFIIILSLAAYTPVMNLIPGYSGNKSRETLIQSIMRVDSIERKLNEIQAYSSDVTMIVDGKTPFIRNVAQIGDSLNISKPVTVERNAADSALRRQMEGTGIYGLDNTQARKNIRSSMNLITPVQGIVTSAFGPREGHFGVGIATVANQQILAVADGTITMSSLSHDEGYIVQIQHNNNMLSSYKRVYRTLQPVGSRVRGGEVIAYTGDGLLGEDANGLFEFELWLNGNPVNPENYVVF